MNRRNFIARCLSGAVLGMARLLPMPEMPRIHWWQNATPWYETDFGMVYVTRRAT